jgi:2'-5' RNA ligase
MRLFFAVEFSRALRQSIGRAVDAIPVKNPPWRWIDPENLHLTLKFLGETDEGEVPALCECAEAVAVASPSFRIALGALGGFPNLKSPRVLFYRVDEGAEALTELAERLDAALVARMGTEPERRGFKAHATIARIKTRLPQGIVRKLESVPPLEDTTETVGKMALMQSRLSSKGARYQCLKAFALSKSK